jgi:hypothetical protein
MAGDRNGGEGEHGTNSQSGKVKWELSNTIDSGRDSEFYAIWRTRQKKSRVTSQVKVNARLCD